MSDDNQTQDTPTPATPAEPTAPTNPTPQSLLAEVAARVASSNPEVLQTWQSRQVMKEVDARVDLLDKAMQKRFQLLTELNKVNRADVETFDADGKLVSGTFTKDRLKAIKDAKESLAKVENAINKALGGDWTKLKEQK